MPMHFIAYATDPDYAITFFFKFNKILKKVVIRQFSSTWLNSMQVRVKGSDLYFSSLGDTSALLESAPAPDSR